MPEQERNPFTELERENLIRKLQESVQRAKTLLPQTGQTEALEKRRNIIQDFIDTSESVLHNAASMENTTLQRMVNWAHETEIHHD